MKPLEQNPRDQIRDLLKLAQDSLESAATIEKAAPRASRINRALADVRMVEERLQDLYVVGPTERHEYSFLAQCRTLTGEMQAMKMHSYDSTSYSNLSSDALGRLERLLRELPLFEFHRFPRWNFNL